MIGEILVRDHMSTDVIAFDPEADILHAAHTLINNNISGAPVIDRQGNLVGMLTERDFMRVVMEGGYYASPIGLVREFMSRNPQALSPDDSILAVAKRFVNGRFHRYPVVEKGRVVGVISRRDAMRAMGAGYPVQTPDSVE
jgi:CBS domain-containing protein